MIARLVAGPTRPAPCGRPGRRLRTHATSPAPLGCTRALDGRRRRRTGRPPQLAREWSGSPQCARPAVDRTTEQRDEQRQTTMAADRRRSRARATRSSGRFPSRGRATSGSWPTSTRARPPRPSGSSTTRAAPTRSVRSTRARRSWTGWSRSRSAGITITSAATTCKWRDTLDQHHRHARPRRLHGRGRAVAARPRRRGRGVRRGRRRRAADRDGLAPGQQVQRARGCASSTRWTASAPTSSAAST